MSIVRVHNQPLSLWQSAVSETAKRLLSETSSVETAAEDLLEHPWVKATNRFALARHRRTEPEYDHAALAQSSGPLSEDALMAMSSLLFDIARAHLEGRIEDELRLRASYWPYSNKDPKFLTCETTYLWYYAEYGGNFLYNDWTVQGKGNINYGVIPWTIPNDGVVAIIGDWGTGLSDAQGLLASLAKTPKLAAVIHIGDIYYSGTPDECTSNFVQIMNRVFNPNRNIPIFTLPGNHDYYALGYGFYPMLKLLNQSVPGANQPASYFCLRTADNGWQFLGMDTGYNDSNPANQVDPFYAGPYLKNSEIQWHWDKLKNFNGATILLSHHQVFSASDAINGETSKFSEFPNLNPFLIDTFQPFFRNKVAGWMWGHEHNFVLYQNNLFGLSKGRLVGASAFEIEREDDPYKINYPNVPYLDPTKYQLQLQSDGHYPHSYALIDFAGRSKPTDPVNVSYYSFPSWYPTAPPSPISTLIYKEQFSLPTPAPRQVVNGNDRVALSVQGGLTYIAKVMTGNEYYPTIGTTPAPQVLSTSSGPLTSGARLMILSTDPAVGSYKYLSVTDAPWLYYNAGGLAGQGWMIEKLDTSVDDIIRYGDAVSFWSLYYPGQAICPTDDGYLTTTTDQPAVIFVIQKPTTESDTAVVMAGSAEAIPAG